MDNTAIRKQLKGFALNLLLVLGSTFLALVTFEIFIRYFMPQDLIVPMPAKADRELIYVLPEHTKAYLKGTSDRWFHLETNSLGLRDVEHRFDKTPGTFRIVLLGDSMSMAEGVELEETYIKQLERLTADRSPQKLETINAAIRGYGNDQELLLFRRIGTKFQPDLVILAFYEENDIDDNMRGGIFKLEDGKLVQTLPTKENSPKLRYYSTQITIQNLPCYRWVVGHSHLANLLRKQVAKFLARIHYDRNQEDTLTLVDPKGLELTLNILQQWILETRETGAKPLLLFLPSYENVRKFRGYAQPGWEARFGAKGLCIGARH